MEEPTQSYFTPDEVNALIPRLEEYFQNFWLHRQNAQNILQELRKSSRDNAAFLPAEIVHQQIRQSQAHFLLEHAQKELDLIIETGCLIKDLEIGLVDFYHVSSSEDAIFLCWKYGEKKVRFWHSLNEGFASRKPLTRKLFPA